jgi:hypothetical protein
LNIILLNIIEKEVYFSAFAHEDIPRIAAGVREAKRFTLGRSAADSAPALQCDRRLIE